MDSCPACDKKDCFHYIDTKNKILTCEYCEAIFLENEICDAFYNEIDYSKANALSYFTKFMLRTASKIITSEYISYLKQKTDMNFKNALDVGSRFGTLVVQLNNYGIDAYGIEADKRNMPLAVTNKIQWSKFDTTYASEKKFDLVCLTQMLYYFRDNHSILKHAKEILTDDGILFVVTFNPSSSLIKDKLLRISKTNTNMVFSKKNFESLKEKIGLDMIDYTTYRSDFYNDMDMSKNKIVTGMKYVSRIKKPYSPDPDGNHAFVLLKPSTILRR